MGGSSEVRAMRSAESSLKGAAKKMRRDALDRPNDPLPLWAEPLRSLPMFMAIERLDQPQRRWVPIRSVFPDRDRITDDQVREMSTNLIETAKTRIESLPPLVALFHLSSEWGGEIFGTKDAKALAAYAAMGFTHVPVTVANSSRFTDASLRLPAPAVTSSTARLRVRSARIAQDMGLVSQKTFPFGVKQDRDLAVLWRIHDCLRDFLLEGELVRDDAANHFTATIRGTSLFPWLADSRLGVIQQAFTTAYPNQTRHARVPSIPEGEEWMRRTSLPPSISSDED